MLKHTKIDKFFKQKSKLTLLNKKYLGQVKTLTNFWLQEDLDNRGDITTKLLIKQNKAVKAQVIAKQVGIIAGIEEIVWLLGHHKIKVRILKKDGQKIKSGEKILQLSGGVKDILKLERTVLNLLQRMSGIASQTNEIIKKVGKKILICPTRKTQWGLLDKKAVSVGGGGTHRLGLYDFILIKENHLKHGKVEIKKITNRFWEIEVENIAQALGMAKLNPGAIMFDNFKPSRINQAIKQIKKINPNIIFEASGGIDENNIKEYAKSGVDIISLGMLTHSVKALDIGMYII